ncbi:MAG: methyltransferase [Chloroflexi bacterium]|nr:methyltransferase [Chloroflexota bacterium]
MTPSPSEPAALASAVKAAASDPRTPEYVTTLNRLSRGYWAAAVGHAATRLGVFPALGIASRSAADLAAELGCSARYLDSLLDACTTLGLLEHDGGGYRNSPLALALLLPGQPAYQGDMVRHRHDLWVNWGRLDEAVRRGAPLPLDLPTPQAVADFVQNYAMGHDNIAGGGQTRFFLGAVPLPDEGHLLDVGGGAASYAIAACQAITGLRATVIELAEAAAIGRRQAELGGVADRVTMLAGDYHTLDFPPSDVVLFSAVLCQEGPESRRLLLDKAYQALRPGGLIVVQDALRLAGQEDKAGLMALFDLLILLLYSAEGGAFAADDMVRWLDGAGFGPAQQVPLPGLFSIVYARRPAER